MSRCRGWNFIEKLVRRLNVPLTWRTSSQSHSIFGLLLRRWDRKIINWSFGCRQNGVWRIKKTILSGRRIRSRKAHVLQRICLHFYRACIRISRTYCLHCLPDNQEGWLLKVLGPCKRIGWRHDHNSHHWCPLRWRLSPHILITSGANLKLSRTFIICVKKFDGTYQWCTISNADKKFIQTARTSQ